MFTSGRTAGAIALACMVGATLDWATLDWARLDAGPAAAAPLDSPLGVYSRPAASMFSVTRGRPPRTFHDKAALLLTHEPTSTCFFTT
jgi:hypothetical protein